MGVKQARICACISVETKRELEQAVRTRGFKKGFVVEQALRHHLLALRSLPADVVVPPVIVLGRESFAAVAKEMRRPSKPTSALRRLMKGEADDLDEASGTEGRSEFSQAWRTGRHMEGEDRESTRRARSPMITRASRRRDRR